MILVFKRFILIFLPVTFKWMPEIPKREDSCRLDWYTWGRLKFGWENQDFNKQITGWSLAWIGEEYHWEGLRKFYLGVLWLYEKQDPELAARVLQDKGGGKTVTCKKLWSITEKNFFFFPSSHTHSFLPTFNSISTLAVEYQVTSNFQHWVDPSLQNKTKQNKTCPSVGKNKKVSVCQEIPWPL